MFIVRRGSLSHKRQKIDLGKWNRYAVLRESHTVILQHKKRQNVGYCTHFEEGSKGLADIGHILDHLCQSEIETT